MLSPLAFKPAILGPNNLSDLMLSLTRSGLSYLPYNTISFNKESHHKKFRDTRQCMIKSNVNK